MKNNTLNKGNHITDDINTVERDKSSFVKTDMFDEYESLEQGLGPKLAEMAKIEQAHEHKMAELKLVMEQRGVRMGRLCSVFLILSICYFTSTILVAGHVIYGLAFAIISFLAMIMLSFRSRSRYNNSNSYNNRNNNYRNNHTRSFTPVEQKATSAEDESDSSKEKKYRNNRSHPSNRYRGKQQ